MGKLRLLLFALLALAAGAGWWFRTPVMAWAGAKFNWHLPTRQATPKPDPKTYAVMVAELARWRNELASRHRKATSDAERQAAEHDAKVILNLMLPAMMRCWLGTPWDFNGTASTPGGGKIACGYFVATLLRDAGFQVDRYKLAQQPSENILRSFLPQEMCRLTVGMDYRHFSDEMERLAHGIYLIGLDTHVGFIVRDSSGFRMIHSSGARPWCVVDESRGDAKVLQKSSWRMFGNLTADDPVIRSWLKAEKIKVRGT